MAIDSVSDIINELNSITIQLLTLIEKTGGKVTYPKPEIVSNFSDELTIFILAVFVGYHVVWRVTPALHAPLMSMTNVISSVIIVSALQALSSVESTTLVIFSSVALCLATINIVGGSLVTHRMLEMFTQRRS